MLTNMTFIPPAESMIRLTLLISRFCLVLTGSQGVLPVLFEFLRIIFEGINNL